MESRFNLAFDLEMAEQRYFAFVFFHTIDEIWAH
ncbi:Uncharacterised protein [Vibrio cholerae]|nr:Uncharacterised protein [Vibrio cholerae]